MLEENITTKRISHEKWSAMYDRITDNGHPLTGWYPTMENAEYLAMDPVGNYEFILWILYSNDRRELSEEERKVEKYLEHVLHDCTEFIGK